MKGRKEREIGEKRGRQGSKLFTSSRTMFTKVLRILRSYKFFKNACLVTSFLYVKFDERRKLLKA